jgi:hypothetical protein
MAAERIAGRIAGRISAVEWARIERFFKIGLRRVSSCSANSPPAS